MQGIETDVKRLLGEWFGRDGNLPSVLYIFYINDKILVIIIYGLIDGTEKGGQDRFRWRYFLTSFPWTYNAWMILITLKRGFLLENSFLWVIIFDSQMIFVYCWKYWMWRYVMFLFNKLFVLIEFILCYARLFRQCAWIHHNNSATSIILYIICYNIYILALSINTF